MADSSSRTALLEDPQLRPFDLCARVEAMPWLRPAARIALQQWLDPASPPSASELKALLDTVERVRGDGARENASDDEEDRGGVIPVAMAMQMGGADSPTNVTARSDKLLPPLR